MPVESPIPGNPNPQAEKEFEPWRCGQPYRFPLEDMLKGRPSSGSNDGPDGSSESKMKNESDPWNFVLEYFATREKVRCDAWKDEVQNLLIFSGLFSAVVTAFLVESYKQLQEDTGAATVVLLSQLVSLANTSSSTSLSPAVVPFTPTSSNIRINIFWFLSLVFSLATAIIGIVSAQWVREHQRPTQGLSPRQEAALLHMNAEGIDRYYIPQIFSMLPLLLLIGLVFFLVGIVDFLWNLNHIVAIPILAAVTITLAFLLISTILPGLQPLPIHLSVDENNLRPPVICSYKSPQSWAFLRLMGLIKHFFKWRIFYLHRLLSQFANKHEPFIKKHFVSIHHFKGKISWLKESFSDDLRANWHEHGLSWLVQRDIHSLSTVSSDGYLASTFALAPLSFLPQHDSLQALLHIQQAKKLPTSRNHSAAFVTLCKCFEDLTNFSFEREAVHSPALAAHVNRVLRGEYEYLRVGTSFHIPVEFQTESSLLVDVARLRFIMRVGHSDFLSLYYAELSVRITNDLLSRYTAVCADADFMHVDPMVLVADSLYYCTPPSSRSIKSEIIAQAQHLVLQVFDHVADPRLLQAPLDWPDPLQDQDHSEASQQKYYVISNATRHTLKYGAQTLMYDPEEALRRTNDVIFTKTIETLENSTGAEADHLFALASIYVLGLVDANRLSGFLREESLKDIRIALKRYKIGLDAKGGSDTVDINLPWKEVAPWDEDRWERVLGPPAFIYEEELEEPGSVRVVPAVILTATGAEDCIEDSPEPSVYDRASERPPKDGDIVYAVRNVGQGHVLGNPDRDLHLDSPEADAGTSTKIKSSGEKREVEDVDGCMERAGHFTIVVEDMEEVHSTREQVEQG